MVIVIRQVEPSDVYASSWFCLASDGDGPRSAYTCTMTLVAHDGPGAATFTQHVKRQLMTVHHHWLIVSDHNY